MDGATAVGSTNSQQQEIATSEKVTADVPVVDQPAVVESGDVDEPAANEPAEPVAELASDPAAEPAADSDAALAQPVAAPAAQPVKAPKRASGTDAADPTTTTGTDPSAEEPAVDPARTVEDGVYWIVSQTAKKQAVSIAKNRTKAGAVATLSKKAKKSWQKWQFTWKNGYYVITNLKSGKVLAVASNKANASVVQAKSKKGDLAQRWSIEKSADGKYLVIKNVYSGKVLNIAGSAAAGTALTAAKASKSKNAQRFLLQPANLVDEGAYAMLTALNTKMALYVPKAKQGTQVAIKKKSGKKMAQRFYIRNEADGSYSIQSVSSGLFLADVNGKAVLMPWKASDKSLRWSGVYANGVQFLNAATGKALAIAGGKAESKAKVEAAKPASGKAQLWTFTAKALLNQGTFTVVNANGGNLDVQDGSYKPGKNVRTQERATSNGSQCFELQYDKKSKAYRLVNTRTYQAVAVKGGSAEVGANVVQAATGNSKAQLWKASINRDGSFSFVNAKSGKALAKKGKKGNVTQRNASTAKNQAWKLVKTKRYSLSGNQLLDQRVATILSTHLTLGKAWSYAITRSYREGARFYSGGHYLSEATTISYANDIISHASGNCYRFASLFSWLARGLGYSTKVAHGWVPSNSGGQAPHGWVELYQNGKTLICDPDLRHESPGYNWYLVTYASAPTSYHFW